MRFDVNNRRVIVVGAGRSGRAAARLLHDRGAVVTLVDTDAAALEREGDLRALGVRMVAGSHQADLLASADLVVLSPGVPPAQPAIEAARRAGVTVIGEVELASRWLSGRMIAITGTKGKSTTTALTAGMLQEGGVAASAGGNIGIALSEQVAGSTADAVHVVEVSSFQLESTDTFHPWISVLVNLSPDHLDRHATEAEYAAAKARIFRNQTPSDWAVVNADDPAALALARGTRARRFDFALDAPLRDGVTVHGDHIVERRDGVTRPVMPRAAVTLPGRHLLADVLAASAVGLVAGVPPAALQRAVEKFRGLEHALETVANHDGVCFVNDSKATNVIAARRSIESFERGVVVIMGGRYKGGEFAELADVVRNRVAGIVTLGEASDRIASALGDVAPVYHAASMRDAVRSAFAAAPAPGVVLLAPACSSFDMFRDYADRGRAFKAAVAELVQERTAQ